MLAQEPKGGSIVNIASVAGQVAVPRRFAYGTTKGAVISMTQSTAMDFVDHGHSLQLHLPRNGREPIRGGLPEPSTTRAKSRRLGPSSTRGSRSAGWAGPNEIAPLALYLASDESGVRNRLAVHNRRRLDRPLTIAVAIGSPGSRQSNHGHIGAYPTHAR